MYNHKLILLQICRLNSHHLGEGVVPKPSCQGFSYSDPRWYCTWVPGRYNMREDTLILSSTESAHIISQH